MLETQAADLINIKLMKAGGIHEALKIAKLAEAYEVECMTGSMIETGIGITAAAHFAASQPNVTRYDFDAPLMLASDTMEGGIRYDGRHITLVKSPALASAGLIQKWLAGSLLGTGCDWEGRVRVDGDMDSEAVSHGW